MTSLTRNLSTSVADRRPHVQFSRSQNAPAAVTTVAVVVINHNSGPHLANCLAALTRQTRRPERIVVIDNASDDGSADGVRQRFPRVEMINSVENLGFAVANNRAIARCGDVEWVALLNADAFPESDWLAALERAAIEHPECDAFGSLLVRADDPGRLDGAGDIYHASGFAWREACGEPLQGSALVPREIFAPCAAAALYRRSSVLEVGGFDESFFCYFEDVDLGLRLRLAGKRARLVPEAVVRHVGSATAGRHSDFTVYHAHRNLVWTWWKNLPLSLLALYGAQHLALQAASLLWFSLRGQHRAIFRAKWDALLELPRVWRARAGVTRRVPARELRRHLARGWFQPYLRRRD